jgi:hypothetical protein
MHRLTNNAAATTTNSTNISLERGRSGVLDISKQQQHKHTDKQQ